ncbi:TPA: UxaA family hydrolase [Salmonella enterica]|nr:UxaA family hydrolase [Salmonella enterica]
MKTFKGYVRPDGQVGIRNHVVVMANAACSTGVVDQIAKKLPEVVPLLHTYGCNYVGERKRWKTVQNGILSNPNIYGAILIGVGCEDFDAREVAAELRQCNGKPIVALIVQNDGGGQAVITKAVEEARKMLADAAMQERQEVPLNKLVFGTECGGSDSLSGVTANPVIGYVSDWVVRNGGTSILSENAELIGTEDSLAERSISKLVADKIYDLIYGEEIKLRKLLGEESSRTLAKGNIDGGLTTIQEKALGCVRKGGSAPIQDVIGYGEPVGDRKGLLIMDGPGNDPISLTGLFSAGAQVAIYSTGRGTPMAHPICPVIKLSSNTRTYGMVGGENGDMDLNAGEIITKGISLEEMGEKAIDYLLEVLNGMETKPEKYGYGGTFNVYTDSPVF